MYFHFLILVFLYLLAVFASNDLEMKKVCSVLANFCPFMTQTTSEHLAKSLVDLYDEINELWEDRFADLPDDAMIWGELLLLKPNLRVALSDVKLQRNEIFNDERADGECLVITTFFTNFARLSSKENYLMTRLSMEHSTWFRKDTSHILQLENRLRFAILQDKHGMCMLDENIMRELKEYFLYGHRFALKCDWHLNAAFLSNLSDHNQTLSIDIEVESAYLHKAIGKDDLRKITGCLKSKDDLIVLDQSAYVKRTSDFYPAYYWMSLYYKTTEQPGSRLIEFSAESFEKDLGTFRLLLLNVSLKKTKRREQHRSPYLKMKSTLLYNVFTTYGRYLGKKEDYLSLKLVIESIFYNK